MRIAFAAQSPGLGTCWIGFSKLLNSNKALLEKLGATQRSRSPRPSWSAIPLLIPLSCTITYVMFAAARLERLT